jgi:hypothetical protein
LIIIACKYTNDIGLKTDFKVPDKFPYTGSSSTIEDVVIACKTHMPNEKIVVVDSNSEDKSYYSLLDGIDIIEGNENYEVGAIWKAYEKYPNEEYYMFLQDTTIPITDLTNYYPKGDKEVVSFLYSKDYETAEIGQQEWCISKMVLTDIPYKSHGFKSFVFNLFLCKNGFLAELKEKKFDKILPTNKSGSACMEMLFGMVSIQLGYSVNYLIGHMETVYNEFGLNLHTNNFIIKNFGKKQ